MAETDAADGRLQLDDYEQMGVTAMLCQFKEGLSMVEVVRAPIKGLPRMQASKEKLKGVSILINSRFWVRGYRMAWLIVDLVTLALGQGGRRENF
jgi:hypothetical protein